MTLAVNGDVFSIAEMGPDFVVLRDARAHPPGEARITMLIDDSEKTWPVDLVAGIVAGNGDTRIARPKSEFNGEHR
jgi:hypothetical protein